jgi:hypothetical protein
VIYIAETEQEIIEFEADNDQEALEICPPGTVRLYPADDCDFLIIDDDLF